MKKNRITKKTFALLTAAISAVTLTGCMNSSKKGSTLEVSFDHSYSSQEVSTSSTMVSTLYPVGENIILVGYDNDYEITTQLYNPANGTAAPLEFEYQKNATDERIIEFMGILTNPDGTISVLFNDYTIDENWEYLNQTYYVETYDSSMKLVSGQDVTENFPDSSYVYNIVSDDVGNVYGIASDDEGNQYIAVFDQSFRQTGTVQMNSEWIDSMFCSANGSVYVSGYSNQGGKIFGRINPETFALEEVDIEGMPEYYNSAFAGSGDYDFYFYDSASVHGVKTEEGVCEEVINWINSDFTGDYIGGVAALPDGKFLTILNDSNYESTTLWLMEERSEEELKDMEIISLATLYSSQNLIKAVCNFNRSSDDCRIVVMDYNNTYSTEENWNASIDQFSKDMTSGKVADIICTDGLAFESYANKGMFLDLYTLMEQDAQFKKEEYFTNYFEAMEYKDSLQRISFSYTVNTLAAKTEYVGEKTGVTASEFMELLKSAPEGMDVFPNMTKEGALYAITLSNVNSFVDTANAVCNFNTPEFIELLELCNTYPSENSIDYESMSDSDWDLYWQAEEMAYRNDTALFKEVYIDEPKTMHTVLMGDFATEDVTFVGYPILNEASNGGLFIPDFTVAVSSQTKYQEEIWSFIKYMLSEEYQSNLEWTMPVNRAVFQDKIDEAMSTEEEFDKYYYLAGEELDIGFPTQEEMDRLTEYVEGIRQCSFYDESIYEIIYEESDMYFNGDQDAQQAVEMMQSRVSLYLSEQS